MLIAEMKKVEAALVVVRDSERLLINLRFSISSHSLGRDLGISGLVPYLKATKRTLRVHFFVIAIRALWLRFSRTIRSGD
jgi:hypothetical protein